MLRRVLKVTLPDDLFSPYTRYKKLVTTFTAMNLRQPLTVPLETSGTCFMGRTSRATCPLEIPASLATVGYAEFFGSHSMYHWRETRTAS